MYHSQAKISAMIRMRKCPARFQAAATAAFPLSEPLRGSADFYLSEPLKFGLEIDRADFF
jgi:hypothetical protein